MKDSSRPLSARGSSVLQDWRASLPEEKAQVFLKQERHLDSLYCMFSISLNEAIELRHGGLLASSLRAISISSELCERLTDSLAGMLHALLHDHARHYGTIPNAAPMNPENYQGQTSQRSARMSSLLNRVLLSHRLQFLHKVSTLEEMVNDLGTAFRFAAGELSDGLSTDPERMWNEVDTDHFDLNTCLREAIVLFKSFLVALPVAQLGSFELAVGQQSKVRPAASADRQQLIPHRRMAAIAGQ